MMSSSIHAVRAYRCFLSYQSSDQTAAEEFVRTFNSERIRIAHRIKADAERFTPADPNSEDFVLRYRKLTLFQTDTLIVLLGEETWRDRIVDWEIACALLNSNGVQRCAVCAITLPGSASKISRLPPRFHDNWNRQDGYARWFKYPEDSSHLQRMLAAAHVASQLRAGQANNDRPLVTEDYASE